MSAHLCLIAWKAPIGRPNWTRELGVLDGHVQAALRAADLLGGERDGARPGASAATRRRPPPSVPIRRAGVDGRGRAGASLRVRSRVSSGRRVRPSASPVHGEQRGAAVGLRGHDDQVGGVPVEHERLARRRGASRPAAPGRRRASCRRSVSQRPSSSGTATRGDVRALGDAGQVAPPAPPRRRSASRACAARTTVEKYGAHRSARPISSSTIGLLDRAAAGTAVLLGDRQPLAARAARAICCQTGAVVALRRCPSAA